MNGPCNPAVLVDLVKSSTVSASACAHTNCLPRYAFVDCSHFPHYAGIRCYNGHVSKDSA
jgi:hypothetical protein